MTTFKDRKGREWDITMTLASADRIDGSDFSLVYPKKFSILNPERDFFGALLMNESLLAALIWAIVHPQSQEIMKIPSKIDGKDNEEAQWEFRDGFDGPTIEAARTKLFEEFSNFFPQHKTALLLSLRQYQQARQRIGENLTKVEPEAQAILMDHLDKETDSLLTELKESLATQGGSTGSTSTEQSVSSADPKKRFTD